jgi:hypothetical protein
MAQPHVKIELAAELDRARAALARNAGALRHDLDIPTRFKSSFHQNKAAYIGGATMFGLLLAKLPSRKKKVHIERKPRTAARQVEKEAEKAGIWLLLLQFLFKTLRPLLTSLLTKQVTQFVKSRARSKD